MVRKKKKKDKKKKRRDGYVMGYEGIMELRVRGN